MRLHPGLKTNHARRLRIVACRVQVKHLLSPCSAATSVHAVPGIRQCKSILEVLCLIDGTPCVVCPGDFIQIWRLATALGLCSPFGIVLSKIEAVGMRDISCEVVVHHVMICGL